MVHVLLTRELGSHAASFNEASLPSMEKVFSKMQASLSALDQEEKDVQPSGPCGLQGAVWRLKPPIWRLRF